MKLVAEIDPTGMQRWGCLLVSCVTAADVMALRLMELTGTEFPTRPGTSAVSTRGRVLWLTPTSWLLLCNESDEMGLAATINNALADKSAHASLYGDALRWLQLSGSSARQVLAEYTFLSLDEAGLAPGRVKRTRMADTAVIILRESLDEWLIGVDRSRARHLAESVRSASERLQRLSGVDTARG
jgi:heterotetrameric sarcosine oxidase gamma subunit